MKNYESCYCSWIEKNININIIISAGLSYNDKDITTDDEPALIYIFNGL